MTPVANHVLVCILCIFLGETPVLTLGPIFMRLFVFLFSSLHGNGLAAFPICVHLLLGPLFHFINLPAYSQARATQFYYYNCFITVRMPFIHVRQVFLYYSFQNTPSNFQIFIAR